MPYIHSIFHIYRYILYIRLSQAEICLSQTHLCLSQTQMRQLACQKSLKKVMNGVPVARHGLILGEDEAAASRKLFKHLPGLVRVVLDPDITKKT